MGSTSATLTVATDDDSNVEVDREHHGHTRTGHGLRRRLAVQQQRDGER